MITLSVVPTKIQFEDKQKNKKLIIRTIFDITWIARHYLSGSLHRPLVTALFFQRVISK